MAEEPFAASAAQLGEEEQLVRRYLEEARKAHRCWTGSTPSRLQAGGLLTSQCGDVTGRRRSPPPWEAAVQGAVVGAEAHNQPQPRLGTSRH